MVEGPPRLGLLTTTL